jgi:hypothetical protein
MYSLFFTIILVLILLWKAYKLWKNKNSIGDYEKFDEELIDKLNEGESIG